MGIFINIVGSLGLVVLIIVYTVTAYKEGKLGSFMINAGLLGGVILFFVYPPVIALVFAGALIYLVFSVVGSLISGDSTGHGNQPTGGDGGSSSPTGGAEGGQIDDRYRPTGGPEGGQIDDRYRRF
jgi:hypothetical protein